MSNRRKEKIAAQKRLSEKLKVRAAKKPLIQAQRAATSASVKSQTAKRNLRRGVAGGVGQHKIDAVKAAEKNVKSTAKTVKKEERKLTRGSSKSSTRPLTRAGKMKAKRAEMKALWEKKNKKK